MTSALLAVAGEPTVCVLAMPLAPSLPRTLQLQQTFTTNISMDCYLLQTTPTCLDFAPQTNRRHARLHRTYCTRSDHRCHPQRVKQQCGQHGDRPAPPRIGMHARTQSIGWLKDLGVHFRRAHRQTAAGDANVMKNQFGIRRLAKRWLRTRACARYLSIVLSNHLLRRGIADRFGIAHNRTDHMCSVTANLHNSLEKKKNCLSLTSSV